MVTKAVWINKGLAPVHLIRPRPPTLRPDHLVKIGLHVAAAEKTPD